MLTLDDLSIGQTARVTSIATTEPQSDTAGQLEDIGFTLGEMVVVLTRGVPGGDPLVVRVGQSRFALRRIEARCIRVATD